ncbi:hypothetical protein Nepgr_000347 [Nepenthes gracilis]|uniref:Uncharacterized protein n=1 Tax=Nepenthes gracilis TaxID=150966 RepID=A0AAD3P537_NEPGR|nr:hypothetical protein Nepgr_000347 [Nepenthes gracilis]
MSEKFAKIGESPRKRARELYWCVADKRIAVTSESTGVVFTVRSGHWIKIQGKDSAPTRIAHDLMALLDPLMWGRLNHQGGEDI